MFGVEDVGLDNCRLFWSWLACCCEFLNGLASDRKKMEEGRHGSLMVNPSAWRPINTDEVLRHTTKSYARRVVTGGIETQKGPASPSFGRRQTTIGTKRVHAPQWDVSADSSQIFKV